MHGLEMLFILYYSFCCYISHKSIAPHTAHIWELICLVGYPVPVPLYEHMMFIMLANVMSLERTMF